MKSYTVNVKNLPITQTYRIWADSAGEAAEKALTTFLSHGHDGGPVLELSVEENA